MFAYHLACFKFYYLSRHFAKISTDIFVVVDLSKKADALAVATLCVYQMFTLSNLAYFALLVVTNREDGFFELPIVYLCKEVGVM